MKNQKLKKVIRKGKKEKEFRLKILVTNHFLKMRKIENMNRVLHSQIPN